MREVERRGGGGQRMVASPCGRGGLAASERKETTTPRQMIDTGIPWIGQVPEGWKVAPFKYYLSQNDAGVWGNDPTGHFDLPVMRSTEQTVEGEWSIEDPALRDLSDVHNVDYYRILAGDLLVTKSSGSALHIGKTTLADHYVESLGLLYSNFIQRLRVSLLCLPRYCWYILNSSISRQQFVYRQNSTSGIGNINAGDINALIIPLPPLPTQRAIAAYLDGECGKIDALRTKIEAQIADLATYKKSVITEAVTGKVVVEREVEGRGGVGQWCVSPRSSKEMKPSGVEWIGDVPAGWSMRPLKFGTTKIGSGKTPLGGANVYPDDGILFLRSQNVYDEGLFLDDVKHISKETNSEMFGTIVRKGDVLLNITGGSIGRCCVYDLIENANVNQHVCIIRVAEIFTSQYVRYFINGFKENIVNDNQQGGNRESLNFEQIGNLKLSLPPLPEQREIAAYLDEKCAAIDAAVAKCREQLTDLASYKKSLIYEGVTGKKEVA